GPFLFAVGGYNDALGGVASVGTAGSTATGLLPWAYTSSLNSACTNCDATAVGNTLYALGSGDGRSVEYATVQDLPTTSTSTTTSTSIAAPTSSSTTTTSTSIATPTSSSTTMTSTSITVPISTSTTI